MFPFSYTTISDIPAALAAGRRGGRYIAGGTTLVDLMRETVERPDELVDIDALPLRDISATAGGGLRLGALVRMADAARHPLSGLNASATVTAVPVKRGGFASSGPGWTSRIAEPGSRRL